MSEEILEECALVLLTIGEDQASEVLRHLTPSEVQRIGAAMTKVGTTSRDRVQGVLARFCTDLDKEFAVAQNTEDYVRAVMMKALGDDRAGLVLDRILQGSDASGIESLKWMDANSVAELVRNEHPQIIASILVHLEADQTSAVLTQFSDTLRNDVVMRIATLDGIQPAALRELNDVLLDLLSGSSSVKRTRMGGIKAAAAIINQLGGGVDQALLDNLREQDPELAQRSSDQMFTFENLLDVDDRGIQMLLREIESETLITALKGASEELCTKVFKNMSQRAAGTMKDDLDAKGPVRIVDVEIAQKEILTAARRLADEGQIVLSARGEGGFV
jgi:flagellar motor switch protein FliG